MKSVCLIVALHLIFAGGSDVVCEGDSCGVDHPDQPDSDSTRLLQRKRVQIDDMNEDVEIDEDVEMEEVVNADEDDELEEDVELLSSARPKKNKKKNDDEDVISKKDISFRLYELSSDSTHRVFGYDKLHQIEVFRNKPTKIAIHGNGGGLDIARMFADAYFSAGEDVNLIGVDWRKPKGKAAKRTEVSGEAVADMIADLIGRDQTTLDDIHLICFSWGCSVSAWASWYLREKGVGLISRLSATDPGRIVFEKLKPDERLSIDDAQLVDVIHTNTGHFGWQWPVGHVDFYPNGGDELFDERGDNHKFAPVLFAQSIKNREAYPAKRCGGDANDAKTWKKYKTKRGGLNPEKCQMGEEVYMGEGVDLEAQHGFYYLETSKEDYKAAVKKYAKMGNSKK